MFRSARLKLTAWYLVIIMSVSILFSMVIFRLLDDELNRNYDFMVRRIEMGRVPIPDPEREIILDPTILTATESRIKLNLFYINLVILGFSGAAGYFLAGRTLKPIKEMMDGEKRFVTDASHELKTPLTALRTTLEVNLRDKNLNLRSAKSVLKDNLEEIEGLQALSENLLILSRQNSGDDLITEKVRLTEVIHDAVAKINILARKKKIKITEEVVDREFEGDREKLLRLFVILLDNAIKYSFSKGTVIIRARSIDHKIKIEVEDQGMGISEDDLPHIFDRFFRADKSRSKTDGYGLGLSIAKKIVELHKGIITVASKIGEGTSFTILLPL